MKFNIVGHISSRLLRRDEGHIVKNVIKIETIRSARQRRRTSATLAILERAHKAILDFCSRYCWPGTSSRFSSPIYSSLSRGDNKITHNTLDFTGPTSRVVCIKVINVFGGLAHLNDATMALFARHNGEHILVRRNGRRWSTLT